MEAQERKNKRNKSTISCSGREPTKWTHKPKKGQKKTRQTQKPIPSSTEDKHSQKRHTAKQNKTNLQTAEMALEWKKTKSEDNGISTQWAEHHQPILNQYKGGGHTVNGFRECGLVLGGKESILGFQSKLLLGKMLC